MKKNAGFSLIELVIVISIMAVLAGVAVPVARTVIDRAARSATLEELAILAEASGELFRDTGTLPEELEDLLRDPGTAGWAGPYVQATGRDPRTGKHGIEVDGWSFDYVLSTRGASVLEITSPGADGVLEELDDHSVTLDVTRIRRERTLEQLAILNGAVAGYNRAWMGSDDLAPPYSAVLSKLVTKGFLPATAPFSDDGWGDAFVCDPRVGVPVVRVNSRSLMR